MGVSEHLHEKARSWKVSSKCEALKETPRVPTYTVLIGINMLQERLLVANDLHILGASLDPADLATRRVDGQGKGLHGIQMVGWVAVVECVLQDYVTAALLACCTALLIGWRDANLCPRHRPCHSWLKSVGSRG